MNENFDFGDGTYGNTANFDPDQLLSDNVTLAFFAYDVSSSMRSNMQTLNEARVNCIESWKRSHHAPSILYSEAQFNEDVTFSHGFVPIETVTPVPLVASGFTALFETIYLGIKNTFEYKKTLESSGATTKCMGFIFTDGEDNPSSSRKRVSLNDIKSLMDDIHHQDESTYSDFEFFIISIDKSNNRYFIEMQNELAKTGIKVLVQDPNDTRPMGEFLREKLTVVSQSVSAGSTNNITF